MLQTTAILGHVDAAGLALIGLLATAGWLRRRGRTRACLAAALGLLGLVSVLGQLQLLTPLPGAVAILNLVCFMGSGYALVELRHELIPLRRGVRPVVVAVIGVTCLLAVPSTLGPVTARPGPAVWVVVCALILEWAGCIAEPAVRFLLVARQLPSIQRKRLRTLSAGYLSLALALVVLLGAAAEGAATSAHPSPLAGFVFQLVATAVLPLLYAGFAPPAWLRRSWRETETAAYRRGSDVLMTFTDGVDTLAGHAVEWATRFVGAQAGLMLAADGTLLASRGLDPAQTEGFARTVRGLSTGASLAAGARVVVAPVPTADGDARIAVVPGPTTPFFGSDELLMLRSYANSVAIAMDRVRVSSSLKRQTTRLESVLQAVSDLGAGLVMAEEGRLTFANDAYLAITGFTLEELQGRPLLDLVPEGQREGFRARMAAAATPSSEGPSRYEVRLEHRSGSPAHVEMVFHRIVDGGREQIIALVQDISARYRAERALADAAFVDALTGIPNRRAWQEHLGPSLVRAAAAGHALCVAILDLDDFKDYNDDWGHQRGDQLLVSVAAAWRSALRDDDFLARYGGDEFAVFLPECGQEEAEAVLERLVSASPDRVSIGLAQWDGSESADEVTARADAALLRAKRMARGSVTVALQGGGPDRFISWSARLEQVLSRRHVTSAYQPIVALDGGDTLGYEALLRIAGSSAGSSVEELFSTAQRLGHSRALDWLGRRTALECAAGLPGDSLLFVNVSARALMDPVHGTDQMLMLLRWTQRLPEEIVLEISEREIISDLRRFCAVLAEYRSHGFRFAHDDVGEGHSTLEVLAAANGEFIKIARSLTEAVGEPGPRSAVRAIITFAESNGAHVIAEGISEPGIATVMRDLGVRFGQGYALGTPQYLDSPAATCRAEVAAAG